MAPESSGEGKPGKGLLATPLELLEDPGVIGDILKQMPYDVLEEAKNHDKSWAWLGKWVVDNPVQRLFFGTQESVDDECRRLEREGFRKTNIGVYSANEEASLKLQIREVRFYFHRHDANKRVMRIIMNTRWPDIFRKALEAAASQQEALLRLVEIARDGGTVAKSWRAQILTAREAGDAKAENHAANKVLASLLSHEPFRTWLLEDSSAPSLFRQESRERYNAFYNADLRRVGRTKADKKWKSTKPLWFKMDSYSDRVAEALSTCWVRAGFNGFPGLCFMSDELLAQLLGHTLPLPSLLSNRLRGGKFIWAVRKRMGLEQAETLFTRIEQVETNKWAILDRYGNRAHWISLRTDKLPPKL